MLTSKTFIGARLDLEHYKGYPIIQHAIEVNTEDDSDYPLSDFSAIKFKLFAKQYGKELDEIDVPVPDDDVLLIDVTAAVMDKRPKKYYHECYGLTDDSPSLAVLLFHGVSEI